MLIKKNLFDSFVFWHSDIPPDNDNMSAFENYPVYQFTQVDYTVLFLLKKIQSQGSLHQKRTFLTELFDSFVFFVILAFPTVTMCSNVHRSFLFSADNAILLELVSKELNHFGVIADLFRQIGGHSSRFVLFSSF